MNKVGGSLISMCGHKPEGLVEHETLIINTPIESICFHHFQLTLLIFHINIAPLEYLIFTSLLLEISPSLKPV